MNRRQLLQSFAALALPSMGFAQSYPSKPIRYIVPVAAGGGNDMIARVVTDRWGKLLGQPFVVDNQSGGGGGIASQTTARAAPDGYTLMQGYVADREDRCDAQRAGRGLQPARKDREGVRRVCEAQSGQSELRFRRGGLADAFGSRIRCRTRRVIRDRESSDQ